MQNHYMHLKDTPYQKIKSGEKEFEFRINDKKRSAIHIDDKIKFIHADHPNQILYVTVLDRIDAPNIPDLLEKITPYFSKIYHGEILYKKLCETKDAYTNHYTSREIEEFGIVAFHIKLDDSSPSPSHADAYAPSSLIEKEGLISRLPAVRGRYTENAPLGAQGWFGCGGTADVIFRPADIDDLIHFLKNTPADIPVSVFGVLSNTIIRDGGVRGIVIKLGREFAGIQCHPGQAPQGREPGPSHAKTDAGPGSPLRVARDDNSSTLLTLGAAALDTNVAMFAADHGMTGLEFLGGIPGTIGGAIKMNAGAIGAGTGDTFGQTSMRDVLVTATAVDRAGNVHIVTPNQLNMSYRHTDAPEDWIFVACTVHATRDPGGADAVTARMITLKERREAAQPVREKTGGSTFANPTPDELAVAGIAPGTRVWQLIDGVSGRGLKIGGAYMSEKHCNFMINDGTATAADLENLGDEIRHRVQDKFGVTLRWEIKRVGESKKNDE